MTEARPKGAETGDLAMSRIRVGMGVMAVLALTACAADGTGPTGLEDAAMTTAAALVAVDGVQQNLDLMSVPDGPAPNRTVTFLDASGNTQAKYDSVTTASIRTRAVLDHEGTREHFTATIHRESDMTVSGLAGRETQRTFNGSSTGKVTRSSTTDGGVTRSFVMTESETVTNVVRPVDHDAHSWPLSGSITRTLHVTIQGPQGDQTKDVTTVVTFNGTQNPTMTVNGVAHPVDLADRKGAEPFRRK